MDGSGKMGGVGRTTAGRDATPRKRITSAARPEALSAVRAEVAAAVRSLGGGDDVADDLQLVASELATNVILHTSSPTIVIDVACDAGDWMLQVADVSDPDLVVARSTPDPDQVGGRGLFVVAAVMDTVEVVEADGALAIRCRRRGP